ncbi:hypothetical protein [Aliikangiella sp. IMCC44359]|uniref:hypothetical protein n=1 Tax=Aliikangiella sp. IMCC44359 TaxID=3459125 RepID=UPI00403AE38E
MRAIKLDVGNKTIGKALTWAYPDGASFGTFLIPTYELTVSGTDNNNKQKESFEVFRFGLQCKKGGTPRVVGLADQQTHIIKAWLPYYTVHSTRSREKGAWQVYDNFLIHDGPDDPKKEVYASIGCIEVCNGPQGFDQFNDFIISLSGSNKTTRASQLVEIGSSKKISITYQRATRPTYSKAP